MDFSHVYIKDLKLRSDNLECHPQNLLDIGNKKVEVIREEYQSKGYNIRKMINIRHVQILARDFVAMAPKRDSNVIKKVTSNWTPGRLSKSILFRNPACPTLHPSKLAPSNYLEKRGISGGLYDEEDISYDMDQDEDLMLSEVCLAVDQRMRQFKMNRTLLFAAIFKFEAGQFECYEDMDTFFSALGKNEQKAFYRMGSWHAMGEYSCVMSIRQVNLKAASLNFDEIVRSPFDELNRSPNDFLHFLYEKWNEEEKESTKPSLRKFFIKGMRNRLFQELSRSANSQNHTFSKRKRTQMITDSAHSNVASGSPLAKINKQ